MSIIIKLKSNHRVRRVVCAGLAATAGILTLASMYLAPMILTPLAAISWAILFLALYLSLRVRLGHLINSSEYRYRDATLKLEAATRHQERLAEDLQQMQVRIYRDICGRLETVRTQSTSTTLLLAEVRDTAANALSGIDHLEGRMVDITATLALLKSSAELTKNQIEVIRHQGDGFRQQLDVVREQGNGSRQQLEVIREQGDGSRQQLEVIREQGDGSRQQLEVIREQGDGSQQQLDLLLQRYERLQGFADDQVTGLAALSAAVAASRADFQVGADDVCKRLSEHVDGVAVSLQKDVRNGNQEIARSLGDYKRVRKVTQEGMQWMKTEVVQEVESLLRLYRLGQDHDGAPLLGGWAMDPAGMLGTLKLIDDADPELIVELGSGTSTVWIAEHLRQRGKGRLISIDHLEEYASVTRQHLQDRGLLDVAEVRLAPLSDIEVNDRGFRWYDTSVMNDIERIDFLLIDGPPTATGPLARYPAMPLLGPRLRKDACVLLDDASRKDEKDAIDLWLQEGHLLSPRNSLGGRVAAFISQGVQRRGIEAQDF